MSARRSGIQNANCAYLAQASESTGGALNQNGQRSTHLIFGLSPMNCLRQRGEDLRRPSRRLEGAAPSRALETLHGYYVHAGGIKFPNCSLLAANSVNHTLKKS